LGPELTSVRRCWSLFGNIRRWDRYPSTCQRQKVTCGFRTIRTIGTSFVASWYAQNLALEVRPGKGFFD